MARKKQETLVLFPEVLSVTKKLSDEQFGALIRAAFSYRLNGEVYAGNDVAVDVAFQFVSNQIDRYIENCATNTRNAGGNNADGNKVQRNAAKPQRNAPPILSYPYPIHSNDIEDKADKLPTRPRFTPPTVDEVKGYCIEKGYAVDPDRFVDYYTSNGWRVGRNTMKDWKAAVRSWNRKEQPNGKTEYKPLWNVGTTV